VEAIVAAFGLVLDDRDNEGRRGVHSNLKITHSPTCFDLIANSILAQGA
jgi:hypothetical protein